MKVLIAVPAYNEESNILSVMESIALEAANCDCIVVNDGSSDKTSLKCMMSGHTVLNLPVNVGIGGAVGCAMKYAWLNNYDAIVQIDGDGQHNPVYIEKLIRKMEEEKIDVVIGSRYLEHRAPIYRIRGFGSRIISLLIRIKTGITITDPTSGMRLYNRKVIELFAKNDYFEPEPNTLVYLLKRGLSIEEVQVKMDQRKAGRSYLHGIASIMYMFRICASIIIS